MPLWLAEGTMHRQEQLRLAAGAEPRDLSGYSEWRRAVLPENRDLMALYADYLSGQVDAMSGALRLDSVTVAMGLRGVPEEDRPEMARRLLFLHGLLMERVRREAASGSDRV